MRVQLTGFCFLNRGVAVTVARLKHSRDSSNLRKKRSDRPVEGAQRIPPSPPVSSLSSGTRPGKWAFRIAALLSPLFLLGTLEAGLRLAGYGYPTTFFLPSKIQGQPVLVDNAQFGWRFFPPTLARSPTPLVMPAAKPAGTYRIFLFGESAALGDPRPAYGVGRYLEVLLRERFPETRFEVVCAAMTAINSHGILPMARECARQHGDLWIVYMGHNEMIGPFGAATVFGRRAPRVGFVRAVLALKATRTGQLLAALNQQLHKPATDEAAWTGLKLFVDQAVAPDDPRKEIVYDNFRRNLEEIVESGLRANANILLSRIACNLNDCPPFASRWNDRLTQPDRSKSLDLLQRGITAQSGTNLTQALEFYRQAAELDPGQAELQFRLGKCWLALTNASAARPHLERARDNDALPCRADSRLNSIVDAVAAEYATRGVLRFDAEAALAAGAPSGIPGGESFFEHVHLTFDGNYRLARAFADEIEKLLPATFTRSREPEWASPERCARRLGLTDWNRFGVYEGVLQRIADAPFTNQLDHVARVRVLRASLADLRSRMQPAAYTNAQALYEEALARAPQDFRLHEDYAEFLEANRRFADAQHQWESVRDLVPQHSVAYFHLARMLARQNLYAAANTNLARALQLHPEFPEARLELGQNLAREGKPDRAIVEYRAVLKRQPGNAMVYVHLANALAALHRQTEAIENLRLAIRVRPSLWEARYLLGVELALENDFREAAEQLGEVVRLRPDHALAHLNLAVALAKLGRLNEAAQHFRDTLRLDPANQKARDYLRALETTARPVQPPPPKSE